MTRSILLTAVLVCALAPCHARTPAQSPARETAGLTADQIVDRHVEARGGYERLKKIHSLVFRGTYKEPGFELPGAAMALMRPYYKLVGDPDRLSNDFREGYDGSAWEFYGDPGIVLRTVGAASAAARHHADVDGPLVDYRAKGSTVTLVGVDSVGGRKAYCLRVRMQDGFEEDELIDAETWHLVASRRTAPIHAFGAAVRSETRFGDFRAFEGVLFPMSIREVEIGTERLLSEMVYSSITVNAPLDVAVFSPPVLSRTPLQRLLDQLYAARADTSAVLWSYRGFRRAHPGVDTDDGIQVIGFQMVKMGDHAAAVALLEANAADHPRSTGAAFALGRAYATAGDAAKARAAFERVLALDSGHKRAAEALKQLGTK